MHVATTGGLSSAQLEQEAKTLEMASLSQAQALEIAVRTGGLDEAVAAGLRRAVGRSDSGGDHGCCAPLW